VKKKKTPVIGVRG